MSEIGGNAEPEKKTGIKKKVAHLAGSALAGVALALGADQGSAHADSTPTPIATPTSTPDTRLTQIEATRVALVADIDRIQKEKELQTLADKRDALRASAHISSVDAIATADTTRLSALGQEQARGKMTATAQAAAIGTAEVKSEATAAAKQANAVAVSERNRERSQEGGPPGIIGVLGWLSVGVAGTLGVINRDRIRVFATRAKDWIGGRFGGGTPPAAPHGGG